jgi:hypothetical protein
VELLSELDRLQMLKSLGGEEFDTGRPQRLWAVIEGEYNDPELSGITIEGEIRWLEVRSSDVALHELVKNSKLVRVSDGEALYVKRFEPSRSSGFTVVRLNR